MGSKGSKKLDIQERLELELGPELGDTAPVSLPKLSLAILTAIRRARTLGLSRDKAVLYVVSGVQSLLARSGDAAPQFDETVRRCFVSAEDVRSYVSELLVRTEAKTRLKTLAAVRQEAFVDLLEDEDLVTFRAFALAIVTYVRGFTACEPDVEKAEELAASGVAGLLQRAPELDAVLEAAFVDHEALRLYVGEVSRRLG